MVRRLVAALVLVASPALGATHAQIQAAADNFWATHGSKFVAAQIDYATAHRGRFWQGIATHDTLPDDGGLLAPDLTRRPTDQVDRWSDIFRNDRALPGTNWPVMLRVDVYDGPSGVGWALTACYTKGGETWCRVINNGPEAWRERPWERVL